MLYELRKLTCNKMIVVGVIVCILCGILYSYYNFVPGKTDLSMDMTDEEEYSEYTGKYTEEKYHILNQIVQEKMAYYEENHEDKNAALVFWKYLELYRKAETAHDAIQYRRNVVNNAAHLKQSEKGYYSRLNSKIEKLYAADITFRIHEGTMSQGIADILTVSAPVDMLYILLLIIISCHIFIAEHKDRTYIMVYSSYRGRYHTYIRKISLMIVLAGLLSVLQSISMMTFATVKGNMSDLFEPVQEIKMFMYSPYSLNLFQMLLLITLFRGLAYMALISLFTFVSLFFKGSIVPLSINSLIGLGGFGITYFYSGQFVTPSGSIIPQAEFYQYMRKYSPYVLIKYGLEYLTKYETENIAGYPVTLIGVTVAVNLVIIGMPAAVGYIVYKRRFR